MSKEPIKFPKRAPLDPAVKKMKEMIKWTVFEDSQFPILVGEFLIVGKHDFQSSKIGKKKMEHEKDLMAEDLLRSLREVLISGEDKPQ